MTNKIALTVDIEDWYHTPAVTGSSFSFYRDVDTFMKDYRGQKDFITEPTLRLLKILNGLNLKATFFIVADIAQHYPGLIEKICADGHEIGCHSLHHAILNRIEQKDEFENTVGESREILKKISGQAIIGFRAPGAYISRWMFASLIRLGFRYDSSVNPNTFIRKTDLDIYRITSKPYWISQCNGAGMSADSRLLEMPWPYLSLATVRIPVAGGPFLRFLPVPLLTAGLRDSLRRGDTLFYLHSLDISYQPIPKMASMNSRRPFYFMTSGRSTEHKLMRILKAFQPQWVTCGDIFSFHAAAGASIPPNVK